MHIILYNDSPELLHPFTHMRPTWDVVVGGRTLRTLLETSFPDATIELKNEPLPENVSHSEDTLHLSGCTLPSNELVENIRTDVLPYAPIIVAPWEIITYHKQILEEEIQRRIATNKYSEIKPGIFVADKNMKKQFEHITAHTDNGPIIIEENATLGDWIVLSGPIIIEENCTLRNFTDLKGSYIGPVCKIGGEISNVNFFGYSNKVHHGFVGDSAIAQWVNFGAGSTTSNMKNTYGKVRIVSDGEKMDTDLQFLGSLIGDHTKIAINTTLMTGTILGCAVHAYDVVHGSIPSFTQIFRGQRAELPLDVALKVAERSMARRDVELSGEQKDSLTSIFESTAESRERFNVKPNTKLSFE